MREIKFRAWDPGRKLIGAPSPSDGYGSLNNAINDCIRHGQVLMQFTGLKDKNGREVYEGDMIQYTNKYSGKQFDARVEWFDEQACFAAYRKGSTSVYDCDSDWLAFNELEIIGNIYENPELLKENNA